MLQLKDKQTLDFVVAYTNDVAKLGTKTTNGKEHKQINTYYKS